MDELEITIFEEDDLPYKAPPLDKGTFQKWGTPEVYSTAVLCAQKVIEAIEEHARSDRREVGGLLLGEPYRYEGILYIQITEYIPAPKHLTQQSSVTHFTFTPEIWAALWRIKDRDYEALKVVGWFHSHPGHGIFLSQGMDTKIQGEHFQEPWHTALVFDPKKHQGGFFIWQKSQIKKAPGFFELFDQGRHESIVSWKKLSKRKKKRRDQGTGTTDITTSDQEDDISEVGMTIPDKEGEQETANEAGLGQKIIDNWLTWLPLAVSFVTLFLMVIVMVMVLNLRQTTNSLSADVANNAERVDILSASVAKAASTPTNTPTEVPITPTESLTDITPITVTESLSGTTPITVTESLSDTTPITVTESLSDTTPITPTESLSDTTPITPTESLSDTTPITPTESLSDTTPITATESLSDTTPITATESLSDTTSITPTESLSDTTPITPTESLSDTTPITPTESLTNTVPITPTN